MELVYTEFVRKPFVVEAVQVTTENIEVIAEFVGTLRKKEDGTPYIQVDRRKIPNVFRVYPGFWMTRMGDNTRCYSKRVFDEQFTTMTPEISSWVDWMNPAKEDEEAKEVDESAGISVTSNGSVIGTVEVQEDAGL